MNRQITKEKVVKQILEARENNIKTNVNSKLFSRFWRLVDAYSEGKSYSEIMNEFFNSGTEIKSPRKNY